ncbi:MAG: hypothetical protein LBH47_01860 [Christensenellaceae bacterium]|jgi:D-alanyl-lipoteichoic acid acyltransferase DltB (MBOAT superfamily)|nr:hypothetical protein [Christensenellaceae bacterium]
MSFTSLSFFAFFICVFVIYWLFPKKQRWIILLLASLGFYVFYDWRILFFVLTTSIIIYLTALLLTKIKTQQERFFEQNAELKKEEKKKIKQKFKAKQKWLLTFGVLLSIVILSASKYFDFYFWVDKIPVLWQFETKSIFAVLGISFYTFSALGYLADVYMTKISAEKNFCKFLLFISFFPKIMQGPITRYEELKEPLFAEHKLEYNNLAHGATRILWGLFKKMVIADTLAGIVLAVFGAPNAYGGFENFIGVLFYLIQDYCDFSGYIDLALGLALMLGVKLPENFRRPYFARTVDDYWRRWHITLGTWFKDYVFYPLSMSKFSLKLGRFGKKNFGKVGKFLPAIFGLIVVWLLTGLWHGANWNYIAWGGFYGIIIILGICFEPLWNKIYGNFNRNTWWYRILQHIRTIFILCVGRIIFMTNSLKDAWIMFAKCWYWDKTADFTLWNFIGYASFGVALGCFGLVLIIDIINEIRPQTTMCEKLQKVHVVPRWTLLVLLFAAVIMLGYYGSGIHSFDFGYQRF